MARSLQLDAAIVIGAFTALGVTFGALQLMPKTKGDKLTVAIPVSPPMPAVQGPAPAAPEPIVEPVAAGPAPSETTPPQAVTVTHPIPKPSKRTRKARRIAKAKAEPCVGPLCVLITARK